MSIRNAHAYELTSSINLAQYLSVFTFYIRSCSQLTVPPPPHTQWLSGIHPIRPRVRLRLLSHAGAPHHHNLCRVSRAGMLVSQDRTSSDSKRILPAPNGILRGNNFVGCISKFEIILSPRWFTQRAMELCTWWFYRCTECMCFPHEIELRVCCGSGGGCHFRRITLLWIRAFFLEFGHYTLGRDSAPRVCIHYFVNVP